MGETVAAQILRWAVMPLRRCRHLWAQVTWLVTHWAGCVLYYIALQEGLGVHTWLAIKPEFVASLGSFERRAMPRALARVQASQCRSQQISSQADAVSLS